MLDKAQFAASFAADVPAEEADFMANSQVPWGVAALNGAVTEPAWATKPSWYLVRSDDPAGRAARNVKACGLERRRGKG